MYVCCMCINVIFFEKRFSICLFLVFISYSNIYITRQLNNVEIKTGELAASINSVHKKETVFLIQVLTGFSPQ